MYNHVLIVIPFGGEYGEVCLKSGALSDAISGTLFGLEQIHL